MSDQEDLQLNYEPENENQDPIPDQKEKPEPQEQENNSSSENEDDELDELDEEDYNLIQENTGYNFQSKKQFKRLKRQAVDVDEERPLNDLDRLFDDDERHKKTKHTDFEAEEEEDDLDDFIVDDEDGEDTRQERERERERYAVRQKANKSTQMANEFGFSQDDWAEIYEMFGDGTDYAYALSKPEEDDMDDLHQPTEEKQPKKLDDIYEPAEVEEKMYTDKDEEIRQRDIPERYQLLEYPNRPPVEIEIQAEAAWILKQSKSLLMKIQNGHNQVLLVDAIEQVLKLIRDNREVPFILHHRRDLFHSYLSDQEVWEVYDLNERWKHIVHRKLSLRKWISIIPDLEELLKSEEASTEDGLKDLSDYLQLKYKRQMQSHHQNDLNDEPTEGKKFKRPQRRDLYMLAKDAHLDQFANQFSITGSEFGNNIQEMFHKYTKEDPPIEPLTLAQQYLSKEFNTAELVLKATKHYLALELSTDLKVRSGLRQYVSKYATITVQPTERGKLEIDPQHEYYPFKYLKPKPISEFQDEQFLMIHKASNEGLLMYEVQIEYQSIISQVGLFYLNDNYGSISQLWDHLRRDVLKEAYLQYLIPLMKRYVMDDLLKRGKEVVKQKLQQGFYEKVSMQGYHKPTTEESEEEEGVNVLAMSCGDGLPSTATMGVLLNALGNVVESIKLDQLHVCRRLEQKEELLKRLKDFFDKYRGKVEYIVISGWSLANKQLYETIQQFLSDNQLEIPLEYGNDEVCKLYAQSKRSTTEFPQYPPLLKYCIGLARYVQEPLFEYAALFNHDRDILYLNVHPLQGLLPQEQLYSAFERVMMTVVNQVGVDINRCLLQPLSQSVLPFVCGLGPRKAQSLLHKIRSRGGILENRSNLVKEIQMGLCVFDNCASFLKINEWLMSDKRLGEVEKLDQTRIHPQDYEIGKKMIADALDEELDQDGQGEQYDRLQQERELLEELLLDDYAEELKKRGGGEKRMCLERIKRELMQPYRDERRPYEAVSGSRLFYLLTGETERTLHSGVTLVCSVVRSLQSKRVNEVRLPCGLVSSVEFGKGQTGELERDMPLVCEVDRVLPERFQVDLIPSSESSNRKYLVQLDLYFDKEKELGDLDLQKEQEQEVQKVFQKRSIKHPAFHNFNLKESEEFLLGGRMGECIFRPSSKSPNQLCLSWKVYDHVFQHVEMKELGKENEFGLGRELQIDKDVFSDLDEVIAHYVDPMANLVREIIYFPKFMQGTHQILVDHVEQEILLNPKRIPYVIGVYEGNPGCFELIYKLGIQQKGVHCETIQVTSRGFRFRKNLFKDLVTMIHTFKTSTIGQTIGQQGVQAAVSAVTAGMSGRRY